MHLDSATEQLSYWKDVSTMASAQLTTADMQQIALAPRRRQKKYGAARAFFLVVGIVTAFAIWSSFTHGYQLSGSNRGGFVQRRSFASQTHSASGRLAPRDEEVNQANRF